MRTCVAIERDEDVDDAAQRQTGVLRHGHGPGRGDREVRVPADVAGDLEVEGRRHAARQRIHAVERDLRGIPTDFQDTVRLERSGTNSQGRPRPSSGNRGKP